VLGLNAVLRQILCGDIPQILCHDLIATPDDRGGQDVAVIGLIVFTLLFD
jgi:hypothetical protein